jgi:hypothetical protein
MLHFQSVGASGRAALFFTTDAIFSEKWNHVT